MTTTALQKAPRSARRAATAVAVVASRASRRRQIDPATCERDYRPEEIEFMQAVAHYKRQSGRMFPTCSELLEVVHLLGYVKVVKVVKGLESV